MRNAVSASNMPPCIRSWRARRGPTASISTGMAMPASRPLRTEVRPKRADEEATAKSQASIRPTPPPTADAMDAGDRRLGKIVDRLHRAHHGVGADPPGDGVEPGPGQHPVEVAAGREGAALAADDQHAHRVVGGKGLDGVDDGARGVAVEGVHPLVAVQREPRHAILRPRSSQGESIMLTSGRRRTSSGRSAGSSPLTGRAPAPCACRPGRGCRRPTAAPWRSTDGPRGRTARGSAA